MQKCTLPGWWMKKRAGVGSSITFVLICIFGGAPAEIASQAPLRSGSRVRVTAPDCALRGQVATLRAIRADTLFLETTECPLASVTRFAVSRGQKSHGRNGAAIGFPAGAVLAFAYCQVGGKRCEVFDTDFTPGIALIFGGVGVLVGAIVGHRIKTDLWEEVPLERLRVSLAPQGGGGFALGLSVRF